MQNTIIQFTKDSPCGEYKKGEIGMFLSAVMVGHTLYLVIANQSKNTIVSCETYNVKLIH